MKDERLYLVQMLECIARLTSFVRPGREVFFADRMMQDAVIRNFEIIGEAAKRVSAATREKAPEIPWRRIADFRDVLIHQYEGVDLEETWKRIEQDLPALRRSLERLLGELGGQLPGGTQPSRGG